MLPQIERGRIADDIYQVLRRSILKQKLEAGQRLQVDELAEQLDVSRTPVREALNLLAAEELVEIVPRSGTYVAHPSTDDIEDIFDLRIALEGLAAERLAGSAPDEQDLQELRELLDWAGESGEDKTIQHAEANRAFHERLVEISGNRKLAQIYRRLNAHTMVALIHYSAPEWHERWEMEREEHELILAALEQGNPQEARKAMERHIQRSRTSLIEDIRSDGEKAKSK